jgi:ectoine hydroxylase-related dioxygenase (phytanoyl-CoA dioxygenase family)
MPILQKHQDDLLKRGYVIVPDFLRAQELSLSQQNLARYFPSFDELQTAPERFGFIHEDPEHLQVEFPFAGNELNRVSTHPEIISFVERLLGTEEVLLSQAAIWAKYAGTGDFEQGLHLDYQGNTLVVPREDGDYRQVNFILYYSDTTLELGPTYVVSQEHTRDLSLWPTHRPRKKNPELYKLEKPVLANAGDLLIFGMNTWHRASHILADTGARFSHHMVYRSANHGFQGYHHWPRLGENETLQQFIQQASPRQREVLGFPKLSDPYWNNQTRAAVKLRYPKIEL